MNFRICSLLLVSFSYIVKISSLSIDETIIAAARSTEDLDFFQITSSGKVNMLIEYDLLLSTEDFKELFANNKRKRRAFNRLWPNATVYYKISPVISSAADIMAIQAAIEDWEHFTCLNFIEINTTSDTDSFIIFDNGTKCTSQVGRKPNGSQNIILAPDCRKKGIIIHEIGHAIGWFHEHSRPDRNNYIKIIDTKFLKDQFRMQSRSLTYGVSYDYLSIMHYDRNIKTLDPNYQDKIGQRHGLSFKDIKLANLMYRCQSNCLVKTCPFNGFVMGKQFQGHPECECWCESTDLNQPLVSCSSLTREAHQPVTLSTVVHDVQCHDMRPDCPKFKSKGHCVSRMESMMDICAKTCGFCNKGKDLCMDHDKGCRIMAAAGHCTTAGLQEFMKDLCPASCDHCSQISEPCTVMTEMMGKSSVSRVNSVSANLCLIFYLINFFLSWNS